MPIQIASTQVISDNVRDRFPNFSATTSRAAVTSKKIDVANGLPNAFSKVPLNDQPKQTGRDCCCNQ